VLVSIIVLDVFVVVVVVDVVALVEFQNPLGGQM
jgi:hypothetical protein